LTPEQQKQRVLVVDDETEAREQLSQSVTEVGCEVEQAQSAEEALELVRSADGRYDFLLMDQFFPNGLDGISATKHIHTWFPDLRVIMLSKYGDAESARAALAAGAYRYIFRPCPDSDIISVMRAAEAVRELQETLRNPPPIWSIIEQAGIGVSIIDRTYRILYTNAAQRKMLQLDPKTGGVGGICWVEYNHDLKSTAPCVWCPTKPAMEDGAPHTRMTVSAVGNELRYFRAVASPIRSPSGEIIAAIEFSEDITEHYKADKYVLEAHETEMRLRAALARIRALGYSRARLYELSEDGTLLRLRVQLGGSEFPDLVLPVAEDEYSQATLKKKAPQIYHWGQYGPTLFDGLFDWQGVGEWIEVPLIAGGQCLGKLTIDNKIIRKVPPGQASPVLQRLTHADFEELSRLAAYAAREIASEREARRIKEESARLRELHRLLELVARRSDLQEALQEIVQSAAKLTSAVGAHLRLLDKGKLVMTAGIGPYYEFAKDSRQAVSVDGETSKSAQAYRTKQPSLLEDVAEADWHIKFKEAGTDPRQKASLEEIQSFACFPIMLEGEVVGVLCLQSTMKGFFRPSVIEAVQDFAAMIGPMIQIDRLITELETAKEQLSVAGKVAVHRLRNPNIAIQTWVELIQKRLREGRLDPKFLKESAEAIESDSKRIAGIVRDLERFLKGPMVETPASAIDVNRVLQEAIQGAVASRPQVEVVWRLAEGLPYARLDGRALGEIAEELTVNACNAMKDQGRLIISTALASEEDPRPRGLLAASQFLKITFTDTGPGIPVEKREWVFEPFNTTYAEGSGLGLDVVRKLVPEMGGAIWIEGEERQGATFMLLLPTEPQEVYRNGQSTSGR
jgi:signal transduction histidine kinase/ActR/RegA family two-component response regulator